MLVKLYSLINYIVANNFIIDGFQQSLILDDNKFKKYINYIKHNKYYNMYNEYLPIVRCNIKDFININVKELFNIEFNIFDIFDRNTNPMENMFNLKDFEKQLMDNLNDNLDDSNDDLSDLFSGFDFQKVIKSANNMRPIVGKSALPMKELEDKIDNLMKNSQMLDKLIGDFNMRNYE
jgi:hypothetical protein